MALDPNEELPGLTGIVDDPELFPPSLPAGVQKTTDWYAHRRTFRDGRVVWEFFKRGSGGGPDGQGDAVAATTTLENKAVKEKWEKDREAETNPPTVSAPPTQPNIVSRNPDGSLATTPNPNYTPPAATSTTKPAGSTTQIEGTPLPGGGFDNERPVMVTRKPDGSVFSSEPLTPAEETAWRQGRERSRNPGGKTDQQIADDKRDAQAAADRNKPSVTIREDGKGGVVSVSTYPDGRVETKPVPGITGKPATITHEGVVYERGPDGKYAPAAGIPTPGATGKNIRPFVPDPSQPDLGIGAWANEHIAKIGVDPAAGGISQEDWDRVATAAKGAAETYIQNITSGHNVRRQAEQDERTQRQTLSSQAAADYGVASGVFGDLWASTKPGSKNIMSVIPSIMNEQAKARQEREGTARPAPPLHPMFTGLAAGAGVNLDPSPARTPGFAIAPNQPAAPVPVVAAPAPTVALPPVAAGPAPSVVAPSMAAPPAAPMAPPTVPGPPPAPVTRGAAQDFSNRGINPATGEPTGLPGDVPADAAPTPGVAPSGTPDFGQPGMRVLPQTPSQMPVDVPYPSNDALQSKAMPAEGPVSAWAADALGTRPIAPTTGQPVLPDLQAGAAAQRPVFDPLPIAGRLANIGLPAESIAIAMQELGLLPQRGAA